jgi:putative glutamine amidotransferase
MTSAKATKKAKAAARPRTRVLVLGHADHKVRRAGGDPKCMAYADEKAIAALRSGRYHALLLTGGSDISPSLYGAEPHKQAQHPNELRDLVETLCIEAAVEKGLPILGICRGAQILNATMGGTLNQHIQGDPETGRYHLGHDHAVRSAKGSRLRKAFGQVTRSVVSIHHQAVAKVAPGFVATGWSPDGVVECIESVEGWMVGVQFHPEMSGKPGSQELFDALVAAAAKHAGHPAPVAEPIVYAAPRTTLVLPSHDATAARAKARTRRDPQTWGSPVLTSWKCFRCGITFDERQDHVDHMWMLHGVDVYGRAKDEDPALDELVEADMWEGVE